MARLRPPVQVVPSGGTIPANLLLGPVVEVWAEPEVIATWRAASPAQRVKLPDPLVRAFRNHAAARLSWLTEHGYTLRTAAPSMGSGKPHWARPGELPDTLRSCRSRNREGVQ